MNVRAIWMALVICPLATTAAIWGLFVQTGILESSLRSDIDAALATVEPNARWARISFSGRDVLLSGEAPDEQSIRRVAAAIGGASGVRSIQSLAKVRSWGNLQIPTVDRLETNVRNPKVSGTWQEAIADGLSVEIAGRLYVLGEDKELTAKAGKWSLSLEQPLEDGVYDLNVTIWKAEDSAADQTDDELEIDTQPPPAPEVNALSTNKALPEVSGTWPHDRAAGLDVKIADRVYRLGRDPELTSQTDGGWLLRLTEPVPDGITEVVATAYDAVGNETHDASSGELKVDVTAPRRPTVNSYETTRSFTLTGTWAENDAVELSVRLAGKLYVYKLDPQLRSDGKGNWALVPASLPGEGTYDVVVATKDLAGNTSIDSTKNELVIKFGAIASPNTALEESPRPLSPYLCQNEFKQLLEKTRVEFEGGRAELTRNGKNTVDGLAGIAALCPKARIEIGVHTDSIGDFSVNRRLSQARAVTIMRQLVSRGIDRERLSGVGYGEIRPIATNKTETGRARNRRVELFVKQ